MLEVKLPFCFVENLSYAHSNAEVLVMLSRMFAVLITSTPLHSRAPHVCLGVQELDISQRFPLAISCFLSYMGRSLNTLQAQWGWV